MDPWKMSWTPIEKRRGPKIFMLAAVMQANFHALVLRMEMLQPVFGELEAVVVLRITTQRMISYKRSLAC
jgi:hypothetical protein